MKNYNTLYYLLVVLLIMGAFASMAQNRYGLTILGGVGVAFGLIFLFQFIASLRKRDRPETLLELSSLTVLSFIFAMRVFHLRFPFVEWLFLTAGIILGIVYLKKMVDAYREYNHRSKFIALLVMMYHLAIILFVGSLVTIPFLPNISEVAGRAAFILLLAFIIVGIIRTQWTGKVNDISIYKVITGFRDRSVLLLSLFFIMSLYLALTRADVLPELYSDEFPPAYFKLVNSAETGKESPVNGKYRHEEYKKMYDQFIKGNLRSRPVSNN